MCECGLNVPHEKWEEPCTFGRPFDGTPKEKAGRKKHKYEASTWEVSPESQAIMDKHFGGVNVNPEYMSSYSQNVPLPALKAQKALILRHLPSQDTVTRIRSRNTLAWIDQEIERLSLS